jgi:chromosome segregation ATPase
VARLTAANAKLKGQVDSLSSSNGELLDRMSALTGKWRSSVADNHDLHRQNIAAQEQVAALQQQLAQLQQVVARQQQANRTRATMVSGTRASILRGAQAAETLLPCVGTHSLTHSDA